MNVSYYFDRQLPDPNAATIQVLNTCWALAELDARVTLYCQRIPCGPAECLRFYGLSAHKNLRLVPMLATRWPRRIDLSWRLRAALREAASQGPNCVITRGRAGVALLNLMRSIRRGPSERRIFEAHRLSFAEAVERREGRRWRGPEDVPGYARALWKEERAAIARADGLLCLCQGLRDAIESAFGVARPTLILPSGTSLPASGGPSRSKDIDILYVGKLARSKGVRDLVEAMTFLPGRRLCVVGGTPAEVEELAGFARQIGVSNKVDLLGFVEPARAREFWRRARVGVCPLPAGESVNSEVFTSPLKIMEMMAQGVPIVATDLPSVREILRDGRDALLVPASEPAALAGAIDRLLSDPSLSDRLSREALKRVANHSWPCRARRLMEFLHSLYEGAAT